MLCTFTIEQDQNDTKIRAVVVQSADIKSIEDDHTGHTILTWLAGDALQMINIQGTALENMERLQREELEAVTRVNTFQQDQQQRMGKGLPVTPVGRGKAGKQ